MKLFLLLLVSQLFSNDYILISGLAWHSTKINQYNMKYEYIIEGLGYYKITKNYNIGVMLLSDSHNKLMGTISIGQTYPIYYDLYVGYDVGITSKVIYYNKIERKIFPIIFPKIEYHLSKNYIINIIYLPKLQNINDVHILYTNIGIKF